MFEARNGRIHPGKDARNYNLEPVRTRTGHRVQQKTGVQTAVPLRSMAVLVPKGTPLADLLFGLAIFLSVQICVVGPLT